MTCPQGIRRLLDPRLCIAPSARIPGKTDWSITQRKKPAPVRAPVFYHAQIACSRRGVISRPDHHKAWPRTLSTASSIPFPIATRIADQLRGKSFSSFGAFRKVFWISLANDSELSQQFSSPNLSGMAKRLGPPAAPKSEHAGKRIAFELHHVELIKNGGAVYDADNLRAVTPSRHIVSNGI
ncbi:Colicin [Pseudomonas syringae pv. coryli]|uniref:Colicin n=1 Tax=Pseudomonas syringae pv. coryli TaxID=317659 RepID=A0A0P9M0E2_9PSED|nr:Colicin [Pseudomonas syringae pv. coryli]